MVLLGGPWLLPSSWDHWAERLAAEGFRPVVPAWPEPPAEGVLPHPRSRGYGIAEVAKHFEAVLAGLHSKPIIIGHSFGALLAEILAGRGLARATVAIAPAPFRGVLPLPFSPLRAATKGNGGGTAVPLTSDQFRHAFGSALDRDEAARLHKAFALPADTPHHDGDASFRINPWTEEKVDTVSPARGPLLIIAGGADEVVPPALALASFHVERRNRGVTEFIELPGRGHSLTIDQGWTEVADASLAFVRRFLERNPE